MLKTFSFFQLSKHPSDITAFLKALAIKIGSLAFAIALFISTPSHPISIAIVASEGVPIPHQQ